MNGLTREKTRGGCDVRIVERLCKLGILELTISNNNIIENEKGMAWALLQTQPDYTREDNNTWLLELLSMNCNGAVSNNNNGLYRKLAAANFHSKTGAGV